MRTTCRESRPCSVLRIALPLPKAARSSEADSPRAARSRDPKRLIAMSKIAAMLK